MQSSVFRINTFSRRISLPWNQSEIKIITNRSFSRYLASFSLGNFFNSQLATKRATINNEEATTGKNPDWLPNCFYSGKPHSAATSSGKGMSQSKPARLR